MQRHFQKPIYRRMIFHIPRDIVRGGRSGSEVRPALMIDAFRNLGYEVDLVSGSRATRADALRQAADRIESGTDYDFAYSETTNSPLLLDQYGRFADSPGRPVRYLLWLMANERTPDLTFLQLAKDHGIRIGLFCRDLHWRMPKEWRRESGLKWQLKILLFRYDYWRYGRLIDHLFLPDLAMGSLLPIAWSAKRTSALPPGCEIAETSTVDTADRDNTLRLFYVGGIIPPHYDLTPALESISGLQGVSFDLVCREEEWADVRQRYSALADARINIVHTHGDGLRPHYSAADLFYLVWRPLPYWSYTIPIKVLEAIGHGLPIVTTAGTVAAEFVEREGVGWVVSDADEARHLVKYLVQHRSEIDRKREHVLKIRHRHTWQARTQQVIDTLCDS